MVADSDEISESLFFLLGLPTEPVVVLAVNPKVIAEISAPGRVGLEHIVEIGEVQLVGDGNRPVRHRADLL